MKRIALITSLSLGLALGGTAPVADAATSQPNPVCGRCGSVQPSPDKSVKPNGFRWAKPAGVRWTKPKAVRHGRVGSGAAMGPNGGCYRC